MTTEERQQETLQYLNILVAFELGNPEITPMMYQEALQEISVHTYKLGLIDLYAWTQEKTDNNKQK